MQPVNPLAVPAIRLGPPPQLVGVAGIDQQDLEPVIEGQHDAEHDETRKQADVAVEHGIACRGTEADNDAELEYRVG